ncbi:hypothetical protein HanXRQr2_Chr09g0417371 [Helianthus annuus]|uniref:Uncharacterized protein n=1 Tax=Helianthus annuus TaxID=4232 RepID=A0A9K3IAS6_HELAN|nr:hypothetical protein HanXRQr2_Chr09g0417371 [Helianthus annuus]
MDCGFIKLWRPYSFDGPRPKPHLAYPWAGPDYNTRIFSYTIFKRHTITKIIVDIMKRKLF